MHRIGDPSIDELILFRKLDIKNDDKPMGQTDLVISIFITFTRTLGHNIIVS
jgi:hypothetical protein